MIDIYSSDWIFYTEDNAEMISKDVVTKKIPVEFIIEEGLAYQRAIKHFSKTEFKLLVEDKKTGLKKFTIKFKKKLGTVNDYERNLEDLH